MMADDPLMEEHERRMQMPEYAGREFRVLYVVGNAVEDFRVTRAVGYAINGVHPENDGPDRALWFPALGYTSSSPQRWFESLAEANAFRYEEMLGEAHRLEKRVRKLRSEAALIWRGV